MYYHIIIPHKNRLDCLIRQANYLLNFINEHDLNQRITINYVEQENEIFNLGYSINAGYQILKKNYIINSNDIFWFYPVDILPKKTILEVEENTTKFEALGKAIGIKLVEFEKVNGWCINQYGYGHDDHDWIARCQYHKIKTIHSTNEECFENFIYLNSNEKYGQPNKINEQKNKLLFESSINQEEIYKNNGLSSTSIEITDRFPLFDNQIIFYNKFKILNII